MLGCKILYTLLLLLLMLAIAQLVDEYNRIALQTLAEVPWPSELSAVSSPLAPCPSYPAPRPALRPTPPHASHS